MNTQELETYLHAHIPLSQAMGVEVHAASLERLTLFAPLAPNINHRDTVFGGSASALAILSAWALLYVRLRADGMDGRVIIHANSVRYDKPMAGDFLATARAPDETAWRKLAAAMQRGRMARITVHSTLECQGLRAGEFEGEFVVLPQAG